MNGHQADNYPRETEDQRTVPLRENRSRVAVVIVALLILVAAGLYCALSLWGTAASVDTRTTAPSPETQGAPQTPPLLE